MANDIVLDIATILTQARDEIRTNMRVQGINASGRTSEALQVRKRGGVIELVKVAGENAPFYTLQFGRAGGKVPSGFRDILYQWSIDKGIAFGSDRERNTFAFFLARKIAREGTRRHKQPNLKVYTIPLEKAEKGIAEAMRKYIIASINASVNRDF